jgi:hypothetical protein
MVDWFGGATAGDPQTGYQDRQRILDVINSGISGVDNRTAPTAQAAQLQPAASAAQTQIDQSKQDQFRNMQISQANRLNAIAGGQQMGAGELATRRAAAQAYAQQIGQANMQRGGNAPGAGLAAARNQVTIGGNAAGQAQQAALSDQQNANAQLTGALNAGRNTDVGLATSQAGLNQQTGLANAGFMQQTNLQQGQMNQAANLANLDAQLRQTGMNDQARVAYLQQLSGMDANQLNAAMQAYQAQKQSSGMFGSIMGAVAPIVGALGAVGVLGGGGGTDSGGDSSGPVTSPSDPSLPGNTLGDQFPHGGGPDDPSNPGGGGGGGTGDPSNPGGGFSGGTGTATSGLTAAPPQQGTPPQQTAPAVRGGGMPQNYGYQAPQYGYKAPQYGYRSPDQSDQYVASDKRLKKDVTDARSEVDAVLDALSPKSYSYKDEKYGKGRRAGIMAQDLERTPAGKRVVEDRPDGKMLDVNKALSLALASSARLNERVRELEGKGAKDAA